MKRWDLTSLPPSTEKQRPRDPGPGAPRVAKHDGQIPRVLFSAPECRAVVVELESGETMGDHHVRERAVVHVVSGRVSIDASGETAECAAGTLVTFAPGERHSVHAAEKATLLLLLAPWPAARHYTDDAEAGHAQHLPANASIAPVAPPSGDT
ncbi:MAG TPA: cupin domain-containing protein [Gaiellaceae bacterium]